MLRYQNRRHVCLSIVCPVLLGAGVAWAETIHVYAGESIQAAIAASSAGDDILVHPGT